MNDEVCIEALFDELGLRSSSGTFALRLPRLPEVRKLVGASASVGVG
jgi:hypothetical protein